MRSHGQNEDTAFFDRSMPKEALNELSIECHKAFAAKSALGLLMA